MTTAPPDELLVLYDPTELRARVARRRRGMWGRVVSLGFTVLVLVLLYAFGGDPARAAGAWVVYGAVLAVSLGWVVGYLLAWRRARRELAGIGTGTAVRMGRPGVQLAGQFAPWSKVTGLVVVRRGLGRGPALELRRLDGPPVRVPLDQVRVHPAVLDYTARAYSAGRHGVDLTALDD